MKRVLLFIPFGALFGCLAVLGDVEADGAVCMTRDGQKAAKGGECHELVDGTQVASAGTGTCKAGAWECQPSGVAVCVGAIGPQKEDCGTKDLDEDCDGNPVNGCECEAGASRACGEVLTKPELKAPCKAGVQLCGADGLFGPCQGNVDSKPRNCGSTADNDCNGDSDKYEAVCDCKEGSAHASQGLSDSCGVQGKLGVCATGVATCGVDPADATKGKFGACKAPQAGPRNCASALDNDCNGLADSTEKQCASACRDGVGNNTPPVQTFGGNMFGCHGKVTFDARASLCGVGCSVCSATDWVGKSGGAFPAYHYWTNDLLKYTSGSGTAFGSDNFGCAVSTTSVSASDCGALTPMRVCVDQVSCALPGCSGGSTDPDGNQCNWSGCGLDNSGVNQHFGGCSGNTTAGTLCCCPPPP